MTLDQHIEELRAELRGVTDRHELRQIETELRSAMAERAMLETAIGISPG